MSISYTSAYLELTDPGITHTVQSLFGLVDRVSGAVTGAQTGDTYLLFSGRMSDGSSTGAVASNVVNQSLNVHDIGASDVGKLLDKPIFYTKLQEAVAKELFGISYIAANSSQIAQIKSKTDWYFSGTDSTGLRVNTTSLWDISSEKFVSEATGNFRIIAPGGVDDMSVFVKSELPALLNNTNITDIDGIPRSELKLLADSKGVDAALNTINLRSAEIAHFTQLSTTNIDAWKLVDDGQINLARQDTVLAGGWTERQQALFNSSEFKTANTWLSDLANRIDSIPGASRLLKAMGPIGLMTSFLFASSEAAAANTAGNTQRAKDIMADWAAENLGSEIGAGFGATLGALLVGVASIAGITLATPFAAAVVIGSMLVGGYFGGEAGLSIFHSADGMITSAVNSLFGSALNWVPPRRDPLVLDLDGGGITTSGIHTGAPILFDQDGDGILTATGWIAPGEAIVVRDLNGNGTIDSGRELFGDNTILTHDPRAGQTAAQGFEALADLDALVQSWGHTSAMQTSVQLGSLRGGDASKNVTGRARITWADGQFGYGVFRKGCLLRRIRLVASSSNSAGVTSSAEHKRNRANRLDWFAATSSRATYVRPTSARWASSSCEISKACRRALTAAENA